MTTSRAFLRASAKRSSPKGSTSGWGGWPGPRECCVCGQRVLASAPAQMHTDVVSGLMTARHLECKARVAA